MDVLVYLEGGWLKIGSRKRAGSHGAVRCSDLAVCELIMVLPTRGHVRSVLRPRVHRCARVSTGAPASPDVRPQDCPRRQQNGEIPRRALDAGKTAKSAKV